MQQLRGTGATDTAASRAVVNREVQRLGLDGSRRAAAPAALDASSASVSRNTAGNTPRAASPMSETDQCLLPTITWSASHPTKECAVCVSAFSEGVVVFRLPCSELHIFHKSCLANWVSRQGSCPLCRTAVNLRAVELERALEVGRRRL